MICRVRGYEKDTSYDMDHNFRTSAYHGGTAFLTPRFLDNRSSGIPPHSGQFIWKYLDMKSGGKSLFCRNLTTVDTLVNTLHRTHTLSSQSDPTER